jgi:hypothetical protein
MLEPVSIGQKVRWLGYSVMNQSIQPNSAISLEAQELSVAVSTLVTLVEGSYVLSGRKLAAISALRALANECTEDSRNDKEGYVLDPVAVQNAEAFLRALPDDVPMPEFTNEPDGAVSLDWIASRRQIFSLSINDSNRLAFAWLNGTEKGHGVVRFDGLYIPSRVLSEIRLIKSY